MVCPNEIGKENLINDGCDPSRIWVTGNTVVDALMAVKRPQGPQSFYWTNCRPMSDVACYRSQKRESWGEPLEAICKALMQILDDLPELYVVVPMHKNPLVREMAKTFGMPFESDFMRCNGIR